VIHTKQELTQLVILCTLHKEVSAKEISRGSPINQAKVRVVEHGILEIMPVALALLTIQEQVQQVEEHPHLEMEINTQTVVQRLGAAASINHSATGRG